MHASNLIVWPAYCMYCIWRFWIMTPPGAIFFPKGELERVKVHILGACQCVCWYMYWVCYLLVFQSGMVALHHAANKDYVETMALLVSYGTEVNKPNKVCCCQTVTSTVRYGCPEPRRQ